MNKIKVYNKITNCQENKTQNFLDGFKYIKNYTLFFNLLKEIKEEIDVLPSFPYVKERITDEQQMKVFYIKFKDKNINDQINIVKNITFIKNNKFSFIYNEEKDALQFNLL